MYIKYQFFNYYYLHGSLTQVKKIREVMRLQIFFMTMMMVLCIMMRMIKLMTMMIVIAQANYPMLVKRETLANARDFFCT